MKSKEPEQMASGCPGSDELVDYFRLRLPEHRMLEIEEHFASCELCVDETREVFETLADLDSWTPESHGEAVRRETLAAALAQAEEDEEKNSEWVQRIKRWRHGVVRAADGGIELIVTASGARIVTQTLRELIAPGGIQFEPIAATRGEADTAEPMRVGAAEVLSVEKPDVRVSVGEGNAVEVTLMSWPADRLPPGVLVIDTSGKRRPLRLELKRDARGVYHAEFTPATGEYMVLFAPVERAG